MSTFNHAEFCEAVNKAVTWVPVFIIAFVVVGGGLYFSSAYSYGALVLANFRLLLGVLLVATIVYGLGGKDKYLTTIFIICYGVMYGISGFVASFMADSGSQDFSNTFFDSGILLVLFPAFFVVKLSDKFNQHRVKTIGAALSLALILGGVIGLIWPTLISLIKMFSVWLASFSPSIAYPLYAIIEKLLLPVGLMQHWNVHFFFEAGSYIAPGSNHIVNGEVMRYLAGDPSAGHLAGGYLSKMWALPAIAIAIWRCADEAKRRQAGLVMLFCASLAFLTGIGEPLEYALLFVSPLLYLLYAFLNGLAFSLCILFEIKHSFTFAPGLIDFFIMFVRSTNAVYLFVLGPVWSVLVYFAYYRMILSRGVLTLGCSHPLAE